MPDFENIIDIYLYDNAIMNMQAKFTVIADAKTDTSNKLAGGRIRNYTYKHKSASSYNTKPVGPMVVQAKITPDLIGGRNSLNYTGSLRRFYGGGLVVKRAFSDKNRLLFVAGLDGAGHYTIGKGGRLRWTILMTSYGVDHIHIHSHSYTHTIARIQRRCWTRAFEPLRNLEELVRVSPPSARSSSTRTVEPAGTGKQTIHTLMMIRQIAPVITTQDIPQMPHTYVDLSMH
jgi:hypothetical protein